MSRYQGNPTIPSSTAAMRTVPDRNMLDRLASAERTLRSLQPGSRTEVQTSPPTLTKFVPQKSIDSAPQRTSQHRLHQHFHLHDERVNVQRDFEVDRKLMFRTLPRRERLIRAPRVTRVLYPNRLVQVGTLSRRSRCRVHERHGTDHGSRSKVAPTIMAEPQSSRNEAGATVSSFDRSHRDSHTDQGFGQ